jgi:hypothetical protein
LGHIFGVCGQLPNGPTPVYITEKGREEAAGPFPRH